MMEHVTLSAALFSFSAYAYTTFATKAWVRELLADRDARYERIVTFIKEGQRDTKEEFKEVRAEFKNINDQLLRIARKP